MKRKSINPRCTPDPASRGNPAELADVAGAAGTPLSRMSRDGLERIADAALGLETCAIPWCGTIVVCPDTWARLLAAVAAGLERTPAKPPQGILPRSVPTGTADRPEVSDAADSRETG